VELMRSSDRVFDAALKNNGPQQAFEFGKNRHNKQTYERAIGLLEDDN
jgi:hypothetical protein